MLNKFQFQFQTRVTHRFDVVPRAVKAASANVSQLINLRVIKHRERDIPLTNYVVLTLVQSRTKLCRWQILLFPGTSMC